MFNKVKSIVLNICPQQLVLWKLEKKGKKQNNSNKHNTELRGTAPGANIPKSMFLWAKIWLLAHKDTFWPQIHMFWYFFFKHKISFIYCHIEPTCQKFGTYDEKCHFWLVMAPFALFKSTPPLNSSKTKI